MEKAFQRKSDPTDDILVSADKELTPSAGQDQGGEPRSFTLDVDDFYLAEKAGGKLAVISHKLRTWGVEARGIFPVSRELRVDRQFSKIFFIWFSMNFNVLSFSAGTVGPAVYGLRLRDSCLLILFFNILCSIPPAYLTTWGPKLGLRQMCQARYSFGYYGAIVPSVLSCLSMLGFTVLNCILGGQTLSSVSDGRLNWDVGIVIIAIVSLLISFCGYKVLNWYERAAWIPVLVAYVVAIGLGGKHLSDAPAVEPATARQILSYGSVLAGFVITYSPMASDYTTYMDPTVPSWKLFVYSFLGFSLPIILIQCLGAAFAAAIPTVPEWNAAFNSGSVGELLMVVLSPAKGFGKFLIVLLSLSVGANIAPTMYSFGLSFQVFLPFCARLPRYLFSVLITAIVIPLSLVGAHKFYTTLTNFLGLIGYWASCFISVVLVEHFLFRAHRLHPTDIQSRESQPGATTVDPFTSYDISAWNTPSRLPSGIAALSASLLSFALIVPSMDQVWFTGPIAKHTGDIGFEFALILTALFYIPFRWFEIRVQGRL